MFSYRKTAVVGAALAAIATVACNGDLSEGPHAGHSAQLLSVTGVSIPEDGMRARLADAARLVAVALDNPGVRAQLKASLDASPYREHKLHFRTFLRGNGRALLSGMAAGRRGATAQDVLASLDSLVDLELYIPVPAHRARWQGGRDFLVATALRDHEIPVAFDPDGRSVALTSAEVAPETPTIALVPAETNFGVQPSADDVALTCDGTCDPGDAGSGGGTVGGGGGGGGGILSPQLSAAVAAVGGVVMTFADIPGSYEGFLMGSPEFEVHAMSPDGTGTLRDIQCAGEHAQTATDQPGVRNAAYVYDQNDEVWNGSVTLLGKDQAVAAQAGGSGVVYWIWEDDNTACKIVDDASFLGTVIRGTADLLSHKLNALKALFKPDSLSAATEIHNLADIFSAFQNDDLVGFLVPASEVGMSWSDANYAIVVKNANGSLEVRGRANLVSVSP